MELHAKVDVLLRSIAVLTGKNKGGSLQKDEWEMGIGIYIKCLAFTSVTVQFSHIPYNYSWQYMNSIS